MALANRSASLRWVIAAALATVFEPTAVRAFAPRSGVPERMTLLAGQRKVPLRIEPHIAAAIPAGQRAAWQRFVAAHGNTWQATWDVATGVPARIFGGASPAPGAMASAVMAETYARAVLAAHLDVLAPGAEPSDFVVVANHLDTTAPEQAIRTVAFAHVVDGLRVMGSQVNLRFMRDQLYVIGSEAVPFVPRDNARARGSRALVAPHLLAQQGAAVLQAQGVAHARWLRTEAQAIWPLIGDTGVIGFARVQPAVYATAEGDVQIFHEAHSGAALGWVALERPFTGRVQILSVDRNPLRTRLALGAGHLNVQVGAETITANANGDVTWQGANPASVVVKASGPLAQVVNKNGEAVTATLSLPADGTATWDESGAPERDAQLQAFLHLMEVKAFVRAFAPNLPLLNEQMTANVNIDSQCNANFDGRNVNFFRASMRCENTALLADVVYHEFGHAMHVASILEGVGAFDGAMSEGLSDFLAASMTNDAGMGRGFFFSDAPLRQLDATDTEAVWPRDIGEIHKTGIIFGGAMWDLRKALISKYGAVEGERRCLQLFYGAVQRAPNIPATVIELLATDDDDGNLGNGTPNECLIREAFGRHGLRTVQGLVTAPGAVTATTGTQDITLQLRGLAARCQSDTVKRLEVFYKARRGEPSGGKVEAVLVNADGQGVANYAAAVPLPAHEALEYHAEVTYQDDTYTMLPDNPGDREYHLYAGATEPLYCTDFEQDPFAQGWQATTTSSVPFEWGDPSKVAPDVNDPPAAFSGSKILALGLGRIYSKNSTWQLSLPPIDTGHFSDVRLQYRRWLTVEDGFFDQATITANGNIAWQNLNSNMGDNSGTHTIDREWRFVDLPLRAAYRGSALQLAYTLKTDEGLHLGGWQLDDVCVVVNPDAVCGDGVQSATEQCDDGQANANAPNRCRLDCFLPVQGDGILDDGETCDLPGDGCSALSVGGGGLCAVRGNAGAARGSLLLIALCGGGLTRRRQRRLRGQRRATASA